MVWPNKSEQSHFQEAILVRTPSNGPQKGGLPVKKLTTRVGRIEEFKR